MLACLTTSAHFDNSAEIRLPNCSGFPPAGTPPSADMRAFTSDASKIRLHSAFSRLTNSGDVRTGTRTPTQEVTSYPGSPDSAIVGSSGVNGDRCALVTGSALTRPALM